jgi:hypothetical protein
VTIPKVAVIVGPSGTSTAHYRDLANRAVAEARRYTPHVVRVYSPNATWSRVRAAMTGASVVVYFGRGRGFPSPYSAALHRATQDGLGLNPAAGVNNSTTRYYGEAYVRRVALAPNAVVLLSHVPYASGSRSTGVAQPTQAVARLRVDNYGAGFLAAGASAVIAELTSTPIYYLRSIFTRNVSLAAMWRSAPTFHGHVKTYSSTRIRGATVRLDPMYPSSRYYRSIVGRVATSTATVRGESPAAASVPAAPTPEPTPTPAPAPTPVTPPSTEIGFYGVGVGMDTLANTTIGGPGHPLKSFMRFRSPYSSALQGFRVYFLSASSPAGYGGGTGGTKRFTIQTDDGSASHSPSGTVIATQNVGASTQSTANYPVAFSSPPTLVAGQIYHLVVENTDSNPDANYFALDYAWAKNSAGDRYHPRWPNSDWGHGYWDGSRWVNRPGYAPILDLDFAAGHYGMGYMEVSLSNYADISGPSKMAREKITVSGGSRTVTTVGIRVIRGSGSDPLVLTLQDADGSAIATASIPAASIRVGSPSGGQGEAVYATAPMSATLTDGSTYYLRLSTASSSTYHAWAIRRGDSYGYDPATTFTDGVAQKTTDGSSWTSLGRVTGQNNLQFYFR